MDLNELGVRHKFREEIARYNKFRKMFGESAAKTKEIDIDLLGYARYLLKEGTTVEKRELLGCIKTRLVLTQKVLTLQG
jgi:hypothetical protein